MAAETGDDSGRIPLFLLKTKSTPGDAYEELFSSSQEGLNFAPEFVPVLEHQFESDGLKKFDRLLRGRQVASSPDSPYGGLIFTSQRAVEAFARLVSDGSGMVTPRSMASLSNSSGSHKQAGQDDRWPHLQDIPIYSVGPATTRALKAVRQDPPLQVYGDHTGNGAELAKFILEHYGQWYADRATKPPLLFLVGEQRRDVIPKSLMDESLPSNKRIQVDEVIVYETVVKRSFFHDFQQVVESTKNAKMRWVVVFSPSGCDAMLRALDECRPNGYAKPKKPDRTTFVATIGPTTRDHLMGVYQFEPDVCAEKPTPEGVKNGILQFLENFQKS